ncbi:MAG TPA: hypothetical protein VD837_06720 [Terriglobales bacterium]|nr:hypothetical protein [Terriglobales bacterium]
MRKAAQQDARERLEQLTAGVKLDLAPLRIAEYGEPAEGILCAAGKLCAEVTVLRLHRKAHIESVLHLPWSTAHKVVCAAACPVPTFRTSAKP